MNATNAAVAMDNMPEIGGAPGMAQNAQQGVDPITNTLAGVVYVSLPV